MTRRLRVLVVDDEPLARSGVCDLVARDPELEVVGECGDGRAAVEALVRLTPDLVLLDVQMPEMDGFDVLRESLPRLGPDRMPAIVFITAYDRFALRAFDVSAVDYVLKPFEDERFADALMRAKRRVGDAEVALAARRLLDTIGDGRTQPGRFSAANVRTPPQHSGARENAGATQLLNGGGPPRAEPTAAPAPPPPPYLVRLVVKRPGHTQLVRADDIDWIEAADYYSRLHVAGRGHLVRETMSSLEARLDPARFARVSRSAIVNLDRVRELRPQGRGAHVVVLADGTRLKLTRERRGRLEAALGQRL